MSTARIVCTSFEDALQLATRLSVKFEIVEIVEPGVACESADLEINLEWCGLDEALAYVSLLLEPADAFQGQRLWSVRAGSDIAAAGQLCEFLRLLRQPSGPLPLSKHLGGEAGS
jgi:hypothetical protein